MEQISSDAAHEFDQTNGFVDGLEGESDGTARGDLKSKREQQRQDLDKRAANIIGGGIGSRRL